MVEYTKAVLDGRPHFHICVVNHWAYPSPVGMVYDKQGTLYVAEWGAGRVSRFDADGKRSSVTEAIKGPSGLAFDGKDTLYVASYSDGSVYALENGKEPKKIASGFSSPAGLLWSRDNALLVANRNAGKW